MNKNPELEGPHRAFIADLALMLAGEDEAECLKWYASTKTGLEHFFQAENPGWNCYQAEAAANRVVEAVQIRKLQLEAATPGAAE